MNLFKSMEERSKIFKNEDVFSSDYLPEEILHREKEINEIAFAFKGISKGNIENLFLFGPTGTGKTSSTKYVLNQLEEYSGRVVSIYLNCWNYSTRYAILNQIAYTFDEFIPRRGLAPDQLIETIVGTAKKENKVPIVILDEVDVLSKRGESSVLYDLLRIGETSGLNIGCVLITNEQDFVLGLDTRIKSSFVQRSVPFLPYRPLELRDIVNERAKAGLLPSAYDAEIVGACAGFGARHRGDARIGIRLLWTAGREAEKQGKERIEIPDVEKGKVAALAEKESESLSYLSEQEKKILGLIGVEWTKSSELYEKLGVDERTVRIGLEKLEKFGFIESEEGSPRGVKLLRRSNNI